MNLRIKLALLAVMVAGLYYVRPAVAQTCQEQCGNEYTACIQGCHGNGPCIVQCGVVFRSCESKCG